MLRLFALLAVLAGLLTLPATALADHIPGMPCPSCADHGMWPTVDLDNVKRADKEGTGNLSGTEQNDQLMGHHGSDVLRSFGGSDILWGDFDPNGQPASQVDRIFAGAGEDFIYGSHGKNIIRAGAGNDAISVHYGRGRVNCGPGRDIYHVARSRRKKYRFIDCEKVDYRPEKVRGGGLKPLP